MIIAYSKHGKSGGVKYAISNKTAKVLAGDPKITEQLIKQNKNKLKYRSGIISFEEKNPPKEVVQDVIDNFIKSTFAGLEPEQYNILMVEHTNTDNYHIHFTIPRLELSTGKSFNPHYYKQDQIRLLKLQDYLNAKHGLSNPFKAKKAKTLQDIDFKALNRNKAKEEINSFIEKLVIERRVQNRDELIKYLTESGLDVVRQSKSFITIKLNDTRIRLKGIYYADTFTNLGAVGEELRRREQKHTAVAPTELRKLEQELDRLIQHKAEFNRKRYKATKRNGVGKHRLGTRATKNTNKIDLAGDRNINRNNIYSRNNISINGDNKNELGERLYKQGMVSKMGQTDTDRNRREEIDDSTRATIIRRIRAKREARIRAFKQAKQAREAVYRQNRAERSRIFEENRRARESLYRKLKENCERQQAELRTATAAAEQLNREAERDRIAVTEVAELRQQTAGRFIEAVRSFTAGAKNYLEKVGRGIDIVLRIRKIWGKPVKQKKKQKVRKPQRMRMTL